MMSVTPAARTCSTECSIMDVPWISWSTLGRSDCMRLPLPPARMTARVSCSAIVVLSLRCMVRTAIEVLHQPQRSARAVRPLVVHLVHQAMDDEHPVPVFLWRVQVGRLVGVEIELCAHVVDGDQEPRLVGRDVKLDRMVRLAA